MGQIAPRRLRAIDRLERPRNVAAVAVAVSERRSGSGSEPITVGLKPRYHGPMVGVGRSDCAVVPVALGENGKALY